MCRNIKTLFNFEPPATSDEVRAASLQFVRKLSGFNRPSKANQEAFELAAARSRPRDREVEAARGRERAAQRFGPRGAAESA